VGSNQGTVPTRGAITDDCEKDGGGLRGERGWRKKKRRGRFFLGTWHRLRTPRCCKGDAEIGNLGTTKSGGSKAKRRFTRRNWGSKERNGRGSVGVGTLFTGYLLFDNVLSGGISIPYFVNGGCMKVGEHRALNDLFTMIQNRGPLGRGTAVTLPKPITYSRSPTYP